MMTSLSESESGTKRCPGCGVYKANALFYRDKRRLNGIGSRCKSCRNINNAKFRSLDPGKARAAVAATLAKKLYRETGYFVKYRAANRVKERDRFMAWYKENRQYFRVYEANRRAMERNAPGKHTADDISFLLETQAGKCAHAWCRVPIKKSYQVDHINPLSRGGSNDRKNLQLLCRVCNQSKHAKHPIDFAQMHGMLL